MPPLTHQLPRKQGLRHHEGYYLKSEINKSIDYLLDKYTIRYINYVDIKVALEWFNEMNN